MLCTLFRIMYNSIFLINILSMKKITIIIGFIIFVAGPIYLLLCNKLNINLLIKLSIDAGIFILLTYNALTNNLIKEKLLFVKTFKNITIVLLFLVSGYSILQSIFLNKYLVMEYIPLLKYTNSFLLLFLLYFTIATKVFPRKNENIH